MAKKEEFKEFVKKNPSLINYVNNNQMTWQKFYEMYDMYGENDNVWDKYINARADNVERATGAAATGLGLAEAFKWFKNIDLDSVQSGVNNLQKVVDIIQDFGHKSTKKEDYKPRPLYKHFDD